MSKADELGTGRSFGQARGRSARGRAKAVTQGDLPTYELVRLHLDEVAATPLNPRRNFGTEEELTRFGEELRQAQLAACVAVSRDAYLALWPDHEARIGSVKHVLINGERRYRSAVHVGLDALDFVVRDDLASSREQFINHLLKENLDREDFDVIERARGVQQLVDICAEKAERGARSRAAEQLGKDRSWVTNQLALLELPEELQRMLSAGSLAERDGRYLARYLKENPGLDAAALVSHLNLAKEAAAKVKAKEKAVLDAVRENGTVVDSASGLDVSRPLLDPDPVMEPSLLSADNKTVVPSAREDEGTADGAGEPSGEGPVLSADNKADDAAPVANRADVPGQQGPRKMGPPAIVLRDPRQIAADLKEHLALEHLSELTELLLEHVSANVAS